MLCGNGAAGYSDYFGASYRSSIGCRRKGSFLATAKVMPGSNRRRARLARTRSPRRCYIRNAGTKRIIARLALICELLTLLHFVKSARPLSKSETVVRTTPLKVRILILIQLSDAAVLGCPGRAPHLRFLSEPRRRHCAWSATSEMRCAEAMRTFSQRRA